jgi:hypothetical protein
MNETELEVILIPAGILVVLYVWSLCTCAYCCYSFYMKYKEQANA